jgi:hypothetical protein
VVVVVEAQRWESSGFEAVGDAVGPPPPLDHPDAAEAEAGGGGCGGRGAPGPIGTGNGTRSAVGGGVGASRTGVGEGGSSRFFWEECLVRVAVGRGGK